MLVACVAASGACTREDAASRLPAEASVLLRFKPAGASYREHWLYDSEAPGTGILRTGLSFEVSARGIDPTSFVLRHALRREHYAKNGEKRSAASLAGVTLSSQWGLDRSLQSDFTVDRGTDAQIQPALNAALAARLGMLIEYPEQAVAPGDSWSIEPRLLTVGPGLLATLRPTYTLQNIEGSGDEHIAVIDSDVQIDLASATPSAWVTLEGGGNASGRLRVRVRDGSLLDARTVLHCNQELRAQGSELVGYREFSTLTHVFITGSEHPPNLAAEPMKLEPADAEEQSECAGLLATLGSRIGNGTGETPLALVGVLHAEQLPRAAAPAPIHDPGVSLSIGDDGKHVELDGAALELRELAKSVRAKTAHGEPIYVFAAAELNVERLRTVMSLLPRNTGVRLVVRAASDVSQVPRVARWVEERQRAALAAKTVDEQRAQLRQLLIDHLALCEPALRVYQQVENSGSPQAPRQIVQAFAKCGCTTTNLDGLESSLYALFGSASQGYLRLRSAELARVPANTSLQGAVVLLNTTPPSAATR